MTETEDTTDKFNDQLRQDTALSYTVNKPETTDSKTFDTINIDKISTTVPDAKTRSKTQNRKTQNCKSMKPR